MCCGTGTWRSHYVPPPDGANAIPRLMLEEVIRGQAGEDPCPFPAMWKKKAQPTQQVGGGSAHLCNTVCSYLGLHWSFQCHAPQIEQCPGKLRETQGRALHVPEQSLMPWAQGRDKQVICVLLSILQMRLNCEKLMEEEISWVTVRTPWVPCWPCTQLGRRSGKGP